MREERGGRKGVIKKEWSKWQLIWDSMDWKKKKLIWDSRRSTPEMVSTKQLS